MFVYQLDESTSIFTPKFPLDLEVLIHSHSPPHVAKIVGIPSYERPHIYTVLYLDGSISEYSDKYIILEAVPTINVTLRTSLLPSR